MEKLTSSEFPDTLYLRKIEDGDDYYYIAEEETDAFSNEDDGTRIAVYGLREVRALQVDVTLLPTE